MAYDPAADLASAKAQTTAIYGDQYQTPVVQTGATSAIPMSSLSPAQPITVPTAQPTVDPLAPAVAGAEQTTKSLDQYIKEVTPQQTDTSKQYDKMLGDISSLLPNATGRGQAQLQAETDAGLPSLKKQLADINARILTGVAEAKQSSASYEQLIANLENPNNAQQQGIPMSAIIGQQAQVRKAQQADANFKAANLGVLQAFALGLQGQVGAAQDSVNRAIDLRYKDAEDEINLKMNQLKLLEGKLSKEESIQSEALKRQYADQQTKIAENKDKAKNNLGLAIEQGVSSKFANNSGEIFNTQTGVGYSTPEEFFKAAGVKSFDEAYARGMITDINYQRIAEKGMVQDWINKYPDANISYTDSLEVARQKVTNSGTFQTTQQNNARVAGGRTSGGSGGAGGSTPTGQVSSSNLSVPPKTASENNIRNWLASNWHKLASNSAYYDVWGAASDALRQAGIDPAKYDKTFWDVFRPGEYDANHPKTTATKQTSTVPISQQLQDIINNNSNNNGLRSWTK